MFGQKLTVDSVISSFNKMIADLDKIEEKSADELLELERRVRDTSSERKRAQNIADKLRKLVDVDKEGLE